MATNRSESPHAELFVRSLCPSGQRAVQRTVFERLDALVDRNVLGEYDVWVTGEAIPARPEEVATEYGSQIQERVALFEEWARRNDAALGPIFERRTVSSSVTGEEWAVLRMPSMVLAEYEGEYLRFVAPCARDGRTVSVPERLTRLREEPGETLDSSPLDRPRPAASAERARRPVR